MYWELLLSSISIYLSIYHFYLIIPPLSTKDLRWHWLNYRIIANICIVFSHWSKLLYLALIMVLWGEYPISHFTDESQGLRYIEEVVGLGWEPRFLDLSYQYPANQLACHYKLIQYDRTIFVFSQKLGLFFSNWSRTKINIYYYKHSGDTQSRFSLGLCSVFSC